MLELQANVTDAKWQKSLQGLLWIRVCNALNKLMNCANRICPHIPTCIVENHTQHHIIQRLGQVHANLTESTRYGINEGRCNI